MRVRAGRNRWPLSVVRAGRNWGPLSVVRAGRNRGCPVRISAGRPPGDRRPLYARLGHQSFNLAVYGAPSRKPDAMLAVRLVARAYFGPLQRSDVMWSERLHAEAVTDVNPEQIAELGRASFSRQPDELEGQSHREVRARAVSEDPRRDRR